MLSKKTTLSLAMLGVAILFISMFSREIGVCPADYSSCSNILDQVAEICFPSVPLLIFSGLTFYFNEEIYKSWFIFARFWIPLSMIAVFLTPEYGGHFMNPIAKGGIAFLMSSIFIVVSIATIVFKYIALKRGS